MPNLNTFTFTFGDDIATSNIDNPAWLVNSTVNTLSGSDQVTGDGVAGVSPGENGGDGIDVTLRGRLLTFTGNDTITGTGGDGAAADDVTVTGTNSTATTAGDGGAGGSGVVNSGIIDLSFADDILEGQGGAGGKGGGVDVTENNTSTVTTGAGGDGGRGISNAGQILAVSGIDRIAVMAALQLAHELIDAATVAIPADTPRGADGARRIRKLTEAIDAELARQDSLF